MVTFASTGHDTDSEITKPAHTIYKKTACVARKITNVIRNITKLIQYLHFSIMQADSFRLSTTLKRQCREAKIKTTQSCRISYIRVIFLRIYR